MSEGSYSRSQQDDGANGDANPPKKAPQETRDIENGEPESAGRSTSPALPPTPRGPKPTKPHLPINGLVHSLSSSSIHMESSRYPPRVPSPSFVTAGMHSTPSPATYFDAAREHMADAGRDIPHGDDVPTRDGSKSGVSISPAIQKGFGVKRPGSSRMWTTDMKHALMDKG